MFPCFLKMRLGREVTGKAYRKGGAETAGQRADREPGLALLAPSHTRTLRTESALSNWYHHAAWCLPTKPTSHLAPPLSSLLTNNQCNFHPWIRLKTVSFYSITVTLGQDTIISYTHCCNRARAGLTASALTRCDLLLKVRIRMSKHDHSTLQFKKSFKSTNQRSLDHHCELTPAYLSGHSPSAPLAFSLGIPSTWRLNSASLHTRASWHQRGLCSLLDLYTIPCLSASRYMSLLQLIMDSCNDLVSVFLPDCKLLSDAKVCVLFNPIVFHAWNTVDF